MTEAAPKRRLRCAIYTRKSSEEGLDMEFNSLDAQRESCEAYIASQRAEGWACMREQSSPLSEHCGDSSLAIPATKSVSRPWAQARIGGR